MRAKLVNESLNEYSSHEFDSPWENWKEAARYISKALKNDRNLSLDELVRQCKGWINHMSEKSRRDFLYAVQKIEGISESVHFQRGLSDEAIRDVLMGRYHKGQILGTDINQQFKNAWNVRLYMMVEQNLTDPDESKVLYIGRIQVRGAKAHIDPYYHNHTGKIETQWAESLRELTSKEKDLVAQALENPKSQKHLEEVKKLSGGITPRL
jgi:hypothetical protein